MHMHIFTHEWMSICLYVCSYIILCMYTICICLCKVLWCLLIFIHDAHTLQVHWKHVMHEHTVITTLSRKCTSPSFVFLFHLCTLVVDIVCTYNKQVVFLWIYLISEQLQCFWWDVNEPETWIFKEVKVRLWLLWLCVHSYWATFSIQN